MAALTYWVLAVLGIALARPPILVMWCGVAVATLAAVAIQFLERRRGVRD